MNIRVLNTEKFNRILEPTSFLIKIHKKVYKIDIVKLNLKGTFSLYIFVWRRESLNLILQSISTFAVLATKTLRTSSHHGIQYGDCKYKDILDFTDKSKLVWQKEWSVPVLYLCYDNLLKVCIVWCLWPEWWLTLGTHWSWSRHQEQLLFVFCQFMNNLAWQGSMVTSNPATY